MNCRLQKTAVSWTVLVLYLLVFVAGSWASSFTYPQLDLAQKWHPRKVPAGVKFVGDQVCAECHKTKVLSQSKTGMALAMEAIPESKILTENPLMKFQFGAYAYEIKRKDQQSTYTVSDGKESISLPIHYAFGEGKAGQTYVLQFEGEFYESLVSYYNEIRGLDFTIGASKQVPTSLKQAIGRELSESETRNCFSCHATGATIGGRLNLDQLTHGIRCEACHGPGTEHVLASKSGKPSAKLIFNPNRLSGDELSQGFCASCHRGSDEFSLLKSMELNNVRFQPYRIFHSKCYSDDKRISCTACHDPHEPLNKEASFYDRKCMACHAPSTLEKSTKPDNQTQFAACRVGTKDCASCHMPRLGPASAHFKFTDHYIRVVKSREAYPN